MTDQPFTLRPILLEPEINKRTAEIADRIAGECPREEIVTVGLLKGSFMFMADMVRLLHLRDVRLQVDFLSVSSYGSGTQPGRLAFTRDITTDIRGRWVLVMDDILDTGHTMHFVKDHLQKLKPATLKICVFLDKPGRRKVEFSADYVGFTVPDKFVVGYGLDYDNRFRELPYIAAVEFQAEGL
ncbi:MAG TPA: hypoxanthine phosphoribosyltransferase [bacterium]